MPDDSSSNTDINSAPERGGSGGQRDPLSVDELHGLLASERRRLLLSYLVEHRDDDVAICDLTDAVIERERPEPGPATHRVRVETDLHHVHLPKLTDAGLLDYDPVAGSVTYVGSDRLEALLEASNALDRDAAGDVFL